MLSRRSLFVAAVFLAAPAFALPITFEQRDANHFFARFANSTIEVRPDRVAFEDLTLRFEGSARKAHLQGLGQAAPSTYFRAGFSRTFRQYPKLAIEGLYPGVDAVFYGAGNDLEYDLKIPAGFSADRIRLLFEGARGLRLDPAGNLIITTASGILQQKLPRVFQRNREIPARYVLLAANEAGIRLGKHDRHAPLTIDPVVSYVKYFGGSGSSAASVIATDAQGNVYMAGQSNSVDFPTTSNSFERRVPPPLHVLSNAGKTNSAVQVGTAANVSAVAGTPDGTILYAFTSQGFLLSGDGGATWQQTAPLPVPNTPQSITVNNIALDPFDPATILVATNVGIFGTDSHGEFWGARNTGLPVSATSFVWATNVFYKPTNPYIAYATTNSPSFLFTSADAGNTWTQLFPTYPGEPPIPTDPYPPIAATISPDGNTLYVVDGNGTLFDSLDGGATWTKLSSGLVGSTVIKVDPSNSNTLYVLDAFGLHRSTDGGRTFLRLTAPATVQEFAVDSSGVLYVGSSNLIFVSTDGGNTFTQTPAPIGFDITALTALDGKVYAGTQSPSIPFVLKLDPAGNIIYSTFLSGSSVDVANGIAADAQGNAVVVGYALSADFPFTAPPASPAAFSKSNGFVAKLNPDGSRLIYSRAFSGSKATAIQAVALDSSGSVFVSGETAAPDLPTSANAFQPSLPATPCPRPAGGGILPCTNTGQHDFVSKISPDGSSIVYTTFLTGSCGSFGQGIAVDTAGDAIVAGTTTSPDFPVSANAYQPKFPGASDQLVPPSILAAGFVSKLSPAGDKLLASSFLGGGYSTEATAAALDPAGNVYLTGNTQGFALGTTPGVFQGTLADRCVRPIFIGPSIPYTGTADAFVLKLDPALQSARFLSYLGGGCNDSGSAIALDAGGNLWVSGNTQSPDFPLKSPFQVSGPGFVTELSPDASQVFFSSLSDGRALALSSTAAYVAGANGNLASIAKIDPATTPTVIIDSVGPVVAFPPDALTPGSIGLAPGLLIQITGRNLGPSAKANAQLDATGRLPFVLANTFVLFDNIPAPLLSVQAGSIECLAPFEISATTQVTVVFDGQKSNAVRVGVRPSTPQILAIANADGSPNSQSNSAKAGSAISIYVSGLGETTPLSVDGLVNSPPLPVPNAPVMVFLSSGPVTPQFVGAAPGMIAGITQVNVQVPSAASTQNKSNVVVNSAAAFVYVTQ